MIEELIKKFKIEYKFLPLMSLKKGENDKIPEGFSRFLFKNPKQLPYMLVIFINDHPQNKDELFDDNLGFLEIKFFKKIILCLTSKIPEARISLLSAQPDFKTKYNIKDGSPTFIIFKNGVEIERFDSEYVTVSEIINSFNSHYD